MALDRLTKIDGGGISTTSDYRVGVITATKFVGPIEGTITSADATFTGNVSIAGTLTYEDVTNVDSVGVITARNGIKVSTGTATTALVVDGDARVTGILTVGTGSLTLNGPNNLVNVGTALTLGHTQGLQFHTQNLHSAGFEVNQINASGIITATGADINGDIDVDGHTNLDNVSVAGVTTFATTVRLNTSSDSGASRLLNIAHATASSPLVRIANTHASGRKAQIEYHNTQTNFSQGIQQGSPHGFATFSINPRPISFWNSSTERLRVESNGNISIFKDLDVDGHTNLDNVSIAGVTTFTGNPTIHNADPQLTFRDSNHSPFYYYLKCVGGALNIEDSSNGNRMIFSANGSASVVAPTFVMTGGAQVSSNLGVTGNITIGDQIIHNQDTDTKIRFPANDTITAETAGSVRLTINSSGNVSITNDLDVDGHTNLDNVSIAGVTTITGSGTNLALNVSSGYARVVGGQPSVVAHKSSSTFIHMGVENNANARAFLAYTNGKNFIIGRRNAYTGDNTGYSAADITVNNENAVTLSYDGSTKFTTTNTGAVVTGIMTATSFSGDGSNLTGLSGVSVANQSDNRLVTATGTTDALNAEANLTFDGSTLTLPAVSGANTNSALPVLFQTSSGAIEGGSGLTYNPGGDVLSVNGNHISRQTFRGDGALGTLTCDNHSSTTSVNVSNTVSILTNDNATDAFSVKQGSNEYITVDTNNSSELITLGNTTTNPTTKIISDKQILLIAGANVGGSTDMKHGSESGGGESNSIYITKANSTFDWDGGMVMRGTGGTWGLRISASGSMGTSSDTTGEIFGVHPAEPTNPTHAQSTVADSVGDAYFRVMGNAKIFATVPIYQSGSRPFYFNSTAVTSNETITTSYNAMSVGNITINSGNSVTVQSGARWVIV